MSVAANAAGQLPKSIVKTNAEAKPLYIFYSRIPS